MQTDTNIRNFMAWWLEGLSCLLPFSLRRIMQFIPDRVTVEFKNNQVIFKYYSKKSGEPDDEQAFILDEQINTSLLPWLQKHDSKNTKIELLIPEDDVLRKKMVLPKTARSDLHRILGFEIDRKTPFSADQVFYDHTVEKTDVEKELIHVQLFVAVRKKIEPLLERLNNWEINPDMINITGSTESDGIVMIPADAHPHDNKENQTTLILSTAAFCLFLAVLYVPLIYHGRAVDQLEEEVAERRNVTFQLQESQEKKNNILNRASFLDEKRQKQMPVIAILNELTKKIPDDTWLTRFSMIKGEIQLQGESGAASSMIHSIESSDYFTGSKFRSPVTQNAITKKDRFNLSAKLLIE